MKQPMEDRVVTISRAKTTLTFPAVGDVTVTEHFEVGSHHSRLGWGGRDHHRISGGGYSISASEAGVSKNGQRCLRGCG